MHETVIIVLKGRRIPVDIKMGGVVMRLNELGVETKGCCEGKEGLFEGLPWVQIGNNEPDNQETQDLIARTVCLIGMIAHFPILLLDPRVVPAEVGEDKLIKFINHKFATDTRVEKLSNLNILK